MIWLSIEVELFILQFKENITWQNSSEGNTTVINYFTIFLQTTNMKNFY